MSSVVIVLLGLAGMAAGWFFYSRFVSNRIYQLDPDFETPAHELEDGVDYVPTNKYVLWGHHFTSVAGAAPIVGPAIAVYWGWLPAVLWVVLGTVFFAGVHDLGALWASTRHKGKSIGSLAEQIIGPRTRSLYMIVVFLLLLMVNSVFGVVIAKAFIDTPTAVFPAWSAIAVALIIGQLLHRKLLPLALLATVGVIVLYFSIYVGSTLPLELPETLSPLPAQANWIIILFVYAAIASSLPVWVLLQPRDFINGVQLFIGLILLYGAVLIYAPAVTAPALNTEVAESDPSIIPLLFVTIACGAVSGFHGIVSSGTTSKQLDKETDARFVGYFAAIGEGALALITIVAVSSIALAATTDDWYQYYANFGAGGTEAFVTGGANLLQRGWGLPAGIGEALLATMVVLFAGTTMDSGVRLQRYIIQEWGEIYRLPFLQNGLVATGLAVGTCILVAFGAGGSSGEGGLIIWPLFGSTNQILAAMSLLVISVLLAKLGRPMLVTLLPMIFVMLMSFLAAAVILMDFLEQENYLLAGIDLLVLGTSLLVILDALAVLRNLKRNRPLE